MTSMRTLATRAGVPDPQDALRWELARLKAARDVTESELARLLLRKMVSPENLAREGVRAEFRRSPAARLKDLQTQCAAWAREHPDATDEEFEAHLDLLCAHDAVHDPLSAE